MRRVSFKGFLIGGVTDVVSSNLLGIPFVIFVMVRFDLLHKGNQAGSAVTAAIHDHAFLYLIQLLIGLSCSALGGYVAAWLAKHDELLNATLSSFLCIGIGIYSVLGGKYSGSLPTQLLLLAVTPLASRFGGYVRLSTIRRVPAQLA